MNNFDQAIQSHLAQLPTQLTALLRDEFRQSHLVKLDHLLPSDLAQELKNQSSTLLGQSAKRRSLEIALTGGTPRSYLSVGRDEIRKDNGAITSFFESETVLKYLSIIADEPLHRVPYEPEEYIINSQQKSGDTHGWHFDDYTFALIWVADAPGFFEGGRVEYVNFTEWDKEAPREQLEHLLQNREVRSVYVPSGSCYLMRARTSLHRVAPLLGDTRRTVIVFTYASEADLNDSSISHETMEQIYNEELIAV